MAVKRKNEIKKNGAAGLLLLRSSFAYRHQKSMAFQSVTGFHFVRHATLLVGKRGPRVDSVLSLLVKKKKRSKLDSASTETLPRGSAYYNCTVDERWRYYEPLQICTKKIVEKKKNIFEVHCADLKVSGARHSDITFRLFNNDAGINKKKWVCVLKTSSKSRSVGRRGGAITGHAHRRRRERERERDLKLSLVAAPANKQTKRKKEMPSPPVVSILFFMLIFFVFKYIELLSCSIRRRCEVIDLRNTV